MLSIFRHQIKNGLSCIKLYVPDIGIETIAFRKIGMETKLGFIAPYMCRLPLIRFINSNYWKNRFLGKKDGTGKQNTEKKLTKTRTKGQYLQWVMQNYKNLWVNYSHQYLHALGRCKGVIDSFSFPGYLLRLATSQADRDQNYRKNPQALGVVKGEPHQCSVSYLNQTYHF